MSKDELEKLDYCCKATGKSRSEVIREGIDFIYGNLCKPKEEWREAATSNKRKREIARDINEST